MAVHQYHAPEEFLAATEGFRARNFALTNIIGSVATGVAAGRTYASESWYAIVDDSEVVGCAMRTPPWLLAVSPMPDAAAGELAAVLAVTDPQLPGIVGPQSVAEAIANALDRPGRVQMSELVRVLFDYRPPGRVSGSARPATPEDLELAVQWWLQFAVDAGLPMHDLDTLPEQLLDMIIGKRLLLWEVDANPVAMCGHASPVTTANSTVARIGPVFTPAQDRGRGYGTAVTAAMVEDLIPRSDAIMLFTDEANPTSNGIYERLGFEVVGDIVEFVLDSEAPEASRSVE